MKSIWWQSKLLQIGLNFVIIIYQAQSKHKDQNKVDPPVPHKQKGSTLEQDFANQGSFFSCCWTVRDQQIRGLWLKRARTHRVGGKRVVIKMHIMYFFLIDGAKAHSLFVANNLWKPIHINRFICLLRVRQFWLILRLCTKTHFGSESSKVECL